MVPAAFGAYYAARSSAVLRHYERAVQYFAEEDIHELRVEIKRLRALARLLASFDRSFRPKRALRRTRQLFKTAGVIRDLHVQRGLVGALAEDLEDRLSPYRNHLQAQELEARPRLLELKPTSQETEMDRFARTIICTLDGLHEEEIVWKTRQRLAVLVSRLADLRNEPDLQEVDLHQIRIWSKEARYTLEILRALLVLPEPQNERLDRSLRAVHRALGAWHDADVGLESLRTFLRHHARHPLDDEEAFVEFAERLDGERARMLSKFESRWEGLLQLVSGPAGAGSDEPVRPPGTEPPST